MILRAIRLQGIALAGLRAAPAAFGTPGSGLSGNSVYSLTRPLLTTSAAAAATEQQQQSKNGSGIWFKAGLGAAAGLCAGLGFVSLADSSHTQMQMSSQHVTTAGQHPSDNRPHSLSGNSTPSATSGSSSSSSSWFGMTISSRINDKLNNWYISAGNWLVDILQESNDVHVVIKLLALSGALLPLILVSGLVYNRASGVPLSQSLYKMYCLLYRVEGVHEPNVPAYLVSNIVFMLGFFTLALLLGVVNDEVQRRSDDARCGRNPVHAEGHVLLLNWNSNSPALLHSIAMAEASSSSHSSSKKHNHRTVENGFWASQPTVVVLADKDKAEMDAAVQECVKDRGLKLQVHTRQGSVFKPSHLRKVSASEASTIILLHPDNVELSADAEAMKAAAAMCFKTLEQRHASKGRLPQRMIVQMPSSVQSSGNIMRSILRQTSAAEAAHGSGQQHLQLQVLAMPDDTLVNRIVAQTAAQPGILTVWQDILTTGAHSSNVTCPQLPPEQQQQPYKHVRRCYADVVVCGFIDPEGQVQLNPSEDMVLRAGSRLILLRRTDPAAAAAGQTAAGSTGSAQQLFGSSAAAAAQRLQGGTTYKAQPRNIIVAAWRRREIPELIRSFGEFTPAGSSVTFILEDSAERSWSRKAGNCRFSFMTNKYPTSTEMLLSAGIRSADTVVLGTGRGEPTDQEADARVLAALLQVQEAVLASGMPAAPHVVCPIREYGSASMAINYLNNVAKQMGETSDEDEDEIGEDTVAPGAAARPPILRPEFLVFRDVTSAVLAHVVSEPAYADIITELLFSCEGQEMYLRSPASFNIPLGVPIPFSEVAELARLTNQTAIGLCRDKRLGSPAAASKRPHGHEGQGRPRKALKSLSAAANVELALPGSELITFEEGDSIVALARDFVV